MLYANRNTPSYGRRYGRQRLEGIRARDLITSTPPVATHAVVRLLGAVAAFIGVILSR